MSKVCHTVIAETAKTLAAEAYEVMAREDVFYRMWPKLDVYVAQRWGDYIPFARQSLIGVLTKDFKHEIASGQYSEYAVEKMKAEIHEALVIDGVHKAQAEPIDDLAAFRRENLPQRRRLDA